MNNNPTLAHSSFTPPPPPPPLRVSASTSSLDVNSQQLPLFATPAVNAKPSMARRLFKGWRLIVFRSWLNLLVLLVPIAFILEETMEDSGAWVFSFSLLGLIPLIQLHELTTIELVARVGGSNSGLINASMANIVEIVVASTALRKCELRIVQSTLIGSMLSRILLVLGICFFAGGVRYTEQVFDQTANAMNISLLGISVGAILLPAVYHFAMSGSVGTVMSASHKQSILHMSHSVSIVLMFIYVASLVFQLWSHNHLYQDKTAKSQKHHNGIFKNLRKNKSTTSFSPSPSGFHEISLKETYSYKPSSLASSTSDLSVSSIPPPDTVRLVNSDVKAIPMARGSDSDRNYSGSTYQGSPEIVHDEYYKSPELGNDQQPEPEFHQRKEPQVSLFLTLALLAVVTVGVGFTADWLVESMDELSTTVSKEWVGLILLPAVGSLAECASAINTSYKDQLSFSISVAVGSTIQTALFVLPFMVTVAWIAGKPLALLFDPFESVVLYISVQVMNYVVNDGKSNWLEGLILICLYIIIGVSFWFYPGSTLSSSLAVCHPDLPVN